MGGPTRLDSRPTWLCYPRRLKASAVRQIDKPQPGSVRRSRGL